MVKINCLETAKKIYAEALGNEDVESVYDSLVKHSKIAQESGDNIMASMNDFAKGLIDENEHANKENLLQQLISVQSIIDSLQREELFRQAGFSPENSVTNALMSKMVGSSWKVARNRDNTYTRAMQASDGFYREFARDIQGELTPLFTSKEGQAELANAMYEQRRTGVKAEGAFGKLADIVMKYQTRLYDKLRAVGIDITELDDRIAPNVHNAGRMMELTKAERKMAEEQYGAINGTLQRAKISGGAIGNAQYEFAFQKWNKTILPLIDHDKVFKARNVDPLNEKDVDRFQRASFDNLVNRGKASQQNVNFANKFKKSRVYHWKDGASLVEYNSLYGSGAIQDSILGELAHGFKMLEVVKDWGVNPKTTIERTLKVFDENPAVGQRFNKALEAKKLLQQIDNLTSTDMDYQGTLYMLANGLKAFEVITKMGSAAVTSTQDIYNVASVARQSGKNVFQSIGGSVQSVLVGLSKEDKAILYKFVNTGVSNKLGSLARSEINAWHPTHYMSKGIHWMYKLNLLERADNGNRAYIASVVSQHFASNRKIPWDKLPQSDKDIMGSYGIEPVDYEFTRQSNVKIGSKGKQMITPDSIQEMSNEKAAAILKEFGVENPSEIKIQQYKDSVERKLTAYFRDRIDHAVISPDAYDKDLISFGVRPESQIARIAISLMTQFKSFPVAQWRKTVLPIMRANGATNGLEMMSPFAGKSNWTGMAKMTVATMATGYMMMILRNAMMNKTPPSLDKLSTWVKMLRSSNIVLDMGLGIDPKDLTGSIGKEMVGAGLTDVGKAAKLGADFVTESVKGHHYKNTKKSFYNLMKTSIPYNTFMTKWSWNHFVLDALEDWAQPGKRQKDLRKIKKDTGARQLF